MTTFNNRIVVIAGDSKEYNFWIRERYHACFHPRDEQPLNLTEEGIEVYKSIPDLAQALGITNEMERPRTKRDLPKYINRPDQLQGLDNIILVCCGRWHESLIFRQGESGHGIIQMLFRLGRISWQVFDQETSVHIKTLSCKDTTGTRDNYSSIVFGVTNAPNWDSISKDRPRT